MYVIYTQQTWGAKTMQWAIPEKYPNGGRGG